MPMTFQDADRQPLIEQTVFREQYAQGRQRRDLVGHDRRFRIGSDPRGIQRINNGVEQLGLFDRFHQMGGDVEILAPRDVAQAAA